MRKKSVSTMVTMVALALAVVVGNWHQQRLTYIIFVSRFFNVMLPVSDVVALFKHLVCGNYSCKCRQEHDHCKKG